MKKLTLIIAIVFGMTMTSFADGLFQRGYNAKYGYSGYTYFGVREGNDEPLDAPILPAHGLYENQAAPLGSGIAVLMGLGAAYLVGKKRREE